MTNGLMIRKFCLLIVFSIFSKTEKENEIWKKAEDFFNNYVVAFNEWIIYYYNIEE
jgi:hypothetical protein